MPCCRITLCCSTSPGRRGCVRAAFSNCACRPAVYTSSIRMSWNRRNSHFDGMARWRDYEVRRLWRRAVLFVLDRAGCLLLRFRKPFPMGTPPRRILVVRPEHFGDLVLTLPALRRLRAAFPGARIALLVRPEYAGWMASWDVADEVLPLDAPWTRRPKPPGRGWVQF